MYYICIHGSYSGTSSVLDNRVTMELISLEGEVAFEESIDSFLR